MTKIYFTLTGIAHYYGNDFMEPGMEVLLEKDPDNDYDKEAILVKMPGLGQVGNVANSPYTVVGDSYSAGRMYDLIGDTAVGKVLYKLPKATLCELVVEEEEPYHRPL